ncbi:MAG: hypothetical protein DMF70_13825 [Acidobacteria bacterium]|nr:MAG: hypothetical protein DMF70_13825 [Acidobacteriota bacterium]
MLDALLQQFLDHLRYERNVSVHTLRNYASDLEQFVDYLAPADPKGKRAEPDVSQIDHESSPPFAPSFNSWCAKVSSNRIRQSWWRPRARKRNCRCISQWKTRCASSKRRIPKLSSANATGRFWNFFTRPACASRNWCSSICATLISRTSCCACSASAAKNASCRLAIRR